MRLKLSGRGGRVGNGSLYECGRRTPQLKRNPLGATLPARLSRSNDASPNRLGCSIPAL